MAQRPARDRRGAEDRRAMLERIGDYAKNVAKRASALAEMPPVPPAHTASRAWPAWRSRCSRTCSTPTSSATPTRPIEVWQRDEEVDEMYTSLFRELLTYMMEDPRNITRAARICCSSPRTSSASAITRPTSPRPSTSWCTARTRRRPAAEGRHHQLCRRCSPDRRACHASAASGDDAASRTS